MNSFMYRVIVLTLLILVVFNLSLDAQCPMCKIAAESNLRNGGSSGSGLNAGILYLLLVPYALVGGVAYFWWRNKKNEKLVIEE